VGWPCSTDGRNEIGVNDFGKAAIWNMEKEIKWRRCVS
jgi:hypothetical protein